MRLLKLLKSKLHHARVSYADPEYVGSIEIGADLMKRVGLVDGELVQIWAVDHTARIETYAFSGPDGVIGLNGGAAHFFNPGDRIIIASFAYTDEPITPQIVLLDENNKVIKDLVPFKVLGE
jgi:aspartate 1-decarboxylase